METDPLNGRQVSVAETNRMTLPEYASRIRLDAIADAGLRLIRGYQLTCGADGRSRHWIEHHVRAGAWPARGRFLTEYLIQEKKIRAAHSKRFKNILDHGMQ